MIIIQEISEQAHYLQQIVFLEEKYKLVQKDKIFGLSGLNEIYELRYRGQNDYRLSLQSFSVQNSPASVLNRHRTEKYIFFPILRLNQNEVVQNVSYI